MSVLNKEEFMSSIQARIGEDTSDEALQFIEDMKDTFNDLETKSDNSSNDEWQKKYDDLDKSWREKYKNRFFNSDDNDNDFHNEDDNPPITTFEQLFS